MDLEQQDLGLDPQFEMWTVFYACSSPRFYKRIGHVLHENHFKDQHVRWLFRAARAVFSDTGIAPESTVIVLQRLRRWHLEGKFKLSVVENCLDIFEELEDSQNSLSEDSVVLELAPILKRRMQKGAIEQAVDAYANKEDLTDIISVVEQASKLGVSEETQSRKFSSVELQNVIQKQVIDRMATGVDELDFAIDGGLARGALGCVVGGAGDGKSMMLYQIAAIGLVQGCHVAVATLENPESIIFARLTAAITNVPLAQVVNGSTVAIQRLAHIEPQLGIGSVREFTAKATTANDIFKWSDELGRIENRPVDLLVLDYADKLSAPKEKDEYNAMRVVYEELRVGIHERKIWGWTASQAQRRKKQQFDRTDLDDVADSINKARIVDLMIGLAVRDPQEGLTDREVELFVSKNRLGNSRMSIGPVPTEFEFGRLTASSLLTSIHNKISHIR